jgi:Trp operon repressor
MQIPDLDSYVQRCLQNPEEMQTLITEARQAIKSYLHSQATNEDYEKAFDNMLSQVVRGVKSLKQQVKEAKDALPKAA